MLVFNSNGSNKGFLLVREVLVVGVIIEVRVEKSLEIIVIFIWEMGWL